MSNLTSLEIIPIEKKREMTNRYINYTNKGKYQFWIARRKNLKASITELKEAITFYPQECSNLVLAYNLMNEELYKIEDRLKGYKDASTSPTKLRFATNKPKNQD